MHLSSQCTMIKPKPSLYITSQNRKPFRLHLASCPCILKFFCCTVKLDIGLAFGRRIFPRSRKSLNWKLPKASWLNLRRNVLKQWRLNSRGVHLNWNSVLVRVPLVSKTSGFWLLPYLCASVLQHTFVLCCQGGVSRWGDAWCQEIGHQKFPVGLIDDNLRHCKSPNPPVIFLWFWF